MVAALLEALYKIFCKCSNSSKLNSIMNVRCRLKLDEHKITNGENLITYPFLEGFRVHIFSL